MSARIVLVGLGAVGAGYGSLLLKAGADLRVVADPQRQARYRDQPTVVNGESFRFPLAEASAGPADLALIAVKRGALDDAIALLAPYVGPDTVILSLLNGIDSEEILAAAFPQATVLLSLSVGIDAVREGRDVHYSSLGRIVYGEPTNPGAKAEQVARVGAIFAEAGIAHHVPADMIRELWWKYLINVGVNQVSAIIGAPYRVFHVEGEARSTMIAAQREVIAVANALGISLDDSDLDRWLEVLAHLGPDNFTSMAQDALAGRPTEVDSFGQTMVRLGERTGVAVPVNTVLAGLLKAREAVLARS